MLKTWLLAFAIAFGVDAAGVLATFDWDLESSEGCGGG